MTSPAVEPRRSRVTIIIVWSVLLSMAALVWAFGSPIGGSPDEPAHLAYAWGVTTGQGFGGPDPTCEKQPCPRTDVDVPAGLIPDPECYRFQPHVPADCSGPSQEDPYPSYMTRYPPPYYYVVGTALWSGIELGMDPQDAGYLGRVASAALVLSLLIPAAVMATIRDPRVVPFFVGSLTAMALFMIGTVNPSGLEISAAIAMAVASGLLMRGRSTGAHLLLVYGAAWLAWSRPIGWLWAAMVLVFGIVLVAASQRSWKKSIVSFGWALPVSALAIATAVIWFIYALGVHSASSSGFSLPDGFIESALAILLRWGGIIRENIGVLGWLDTPLPDLAMLMATGLLAVLMAGGFWAVRNRRVGWVVGVYFGSLLAGVTLLMAYQRFLWQGRYVLPSFAAGLVFLGFASVPDDRWRRWSSMIASGLWMIAIAAGLWLYTRYAFGIEIVGRYMVPDLSGDAAWAGPIGAWPLLVIGAITACALPVAMWRLNESVTAIVPVDGVQPGGNETNREAHDIREK